MRRSLVSGRLYLVVEEPGVWTANAPGRLQASSLCALLQRGVDMAYARPMTKLAALFEACRGPATREAAQVRADMAVMAALRQQQRQQQQEHQ